MRVLLTGATGTAGSGALQACLADRSIDAVTALVRRDVLSSHPKLTVVLHQDFTRYDGLDLGGYDACLWCLGIAQSKVTREAYEQITCDATLAAADALWKQSPKARFCFLSGAGADSREKSRILFARIKGKTENALLQRRPDDVVCFRPGYIHPETRPAGANLLESVAFSLAPVFKAVAPRSFITALELGTAMARVAREGTSKKILEMVDLLPLSGRA